MQNFKQKYMPAMLLVQNWGKMAWPISPKRPLLEISYIPLLLLSVMTLYHRLYQFSSLEVEV